MKTKFVHYMEREQQAGILKIFTFYIWIIISVIFTNCTETNSQIPGISSIQDLIDVESKSTVSLDGDSFQIIVPDLAIGKSDSKPDDFLARPASIILAKNNILISDSGVNRIVSSNPEGEIVNTTGSDGRGPGEFLNIQELAVNNQYIFLQDIGNQKILVYDHDLSLIETLNVSTFGPIDANDNHLFLFNSNYTDHLVTVHSAESPFQKKFEFLPVIIPRGKQPSGYNFVKMATNNQSYTLFSYTALPYLFLFDNNLDHVHTIELQGSVVSEIVNQNPDTEPVDAGETTMIRNIISIFAMDDQRNIYL